jgi:hypothetical protein
MNRIQKTANETNELGIEVCAELKGQRAQIIHGTNVNKNISNNLNLADSTIGTMTRREYCIKFILWILALVLFLAIIFVLMVKMFGTGWVPGYNKKKSSEYM